MSFKPLRIDGVAIPTPDSYNWSLEDLSSDQTGRTLDGVMHKDIVAQKATVDMRWDALSWADAAVLFNALNNKPTFSFTHADPRCPNQWITKTFYVGPRSGVALDLLDQTFTWGELSLKLIEV